MVICHTLFLDQWPFEKSLDAESWKLLHSHLRKSRGNIIERAGYHF